MLVASASACRCMCVAGVWGSVDLGLLGSWAGCSVAGPWRSAFMRIASPIRAVVPVAHCCCAAFAAAPCSMVIQRVPRRVEVQPQYNAAHARAFKLPAYAPKCPPQAY